MIIGADGQLGSDLVPALKNHNLFPLTYPEFDILKTDQVEATLNALNPDIVINTAAYNRVDDGEEFPLDAFRLNALAVRDLARMCSDRDMVLVHFSSDYVFDGEKRIPYTEEDTPSPLNVYGLTKFAGEIFVQNISLRYFIIRTSSLFGLAGCMGKGYNFVDLIIERQKKGHPLRIVDDQRMTPTSTFELAERIKVLIETDAYGLYHMSNKGDCTWYEYAREVFHILGITADLSPINSGTYFARAKRPSYSVLDNGKAVTAGIQDFSYWPEALESFMRKKGYIG
ncbi:MAG: dTDP-4-dehydrorhamnose reductase [Candidatus Aminicenantes bacterium]|nr:dTDP-4-dehydrorhamnose reductase [Candidatus Aminicenantes bacterium]